MKYLGIHINIINKTNNLWFNSVSVLLAWYFCSVTFKQIIIWLCVNGKWMIRFVMANSKIGFRPSFLYDKRFRLHVYYSINASDLFLVCLMSIIVIKHTETFVKLTTVWYVYFRVLLKFYPAAKKLGFQ